ncbi:MAG: family acetyltransferase [Paenibacillaceae bacterium]|jgi:GNAT superfamily N-acetyltransferase|nr:family acetyltransferase [Paenibacillaceae bacterium]
MPTITAVQANHPHLRQLVAKLDLELLERYPPEEVFGIDLDDPSMDQVFFIIAYEDGQPAGCGAIRPLDGNCVELKRFFVERSFRRKGVAAALLYCLEEHAKERGFGLVKLETGTEQPESLYFYRKHGFYEIPRYGPYADCPTSLCFEKVI